MELKERNKRIYVLINNKMRYLFKEVLASVEKETKQYDIKSSFFDKSNGNKPTGFYSIRKTLFDHGNNIIELTELILSELELTPSKSIVTIDRKLQKEIENDRG